MTFEKKTWQFNDLITEHELNRIEDGIHEVHEELTPNQKATLSLKEGIQAVNVLSNSALNVQFEGRTLVNLLGRDGNFEVGGGRVDTLTGTNQNVGRGWNIGFNTGFPEFELVDDSVYGTKSQKVTNTSDIIRGRVYRYVELDPNKFYFVGMYCKGDSSVSIRVGDGTSNYNGKFLDKLVTDKWQFYYTKFTGQNLINITLLALEVGSGYIDGVRLYELTEEEYNALDGMTDEEIAALYPYVDSVQHTRNPYVIVKGKNLLPSKFSNKDISSVVYEINRPYHYRTVEGSLAPREVIEVIGGQTYTFSAEKVVGRLWISTNNNNGRDEEQLETLVDVELDGEPIETSFTVPINRSYIRVIIYPFVLEPANSPVELKNWQLELGDTATEFEPYEETYLFGKDVVLAEGERAYQRGRDWYKWQEWEQLELGGNIPVDSVTVQSFEGFKRISILNVIYGHVSDGESSPENWGINKLVKYDGKLLESIGITTEKADAFSLTITNSINISISNQDSGWGDDYTPTPEEIKAYFMGWQMNNGTFGQPYNGTGTKTWVPLGDTDNSRATTTLPTSVSPTITEGKITHYQLHYRLAEPREVPVTFEGSLRVREGLNQIEVGTGVVVRERATAALNSIFEYTINDNHPNYAQTRFDYRTKKILQVYKNGKQEVNPPIVADKSAYGLERLLYKRQDFDPTAAYHVTYFVLDKHLFTAEFGGITAEYNTNLATRLEENEKELIAQARKVSVLENELFPLLQGEIVDHNLHVENPPLGHYIRWANGLQVCFGEVVTDVDTSVTLGNLYVSPKPTIIDYPSFFSKPPAWSISMSGKDRFTGSYYWQSSDWDDNYGSILKFYLMSPSSREVKNLVIRYFAIGRWK